MTVYRRNVGAAWFRLHSIALPKCTVDSSASWRRCTARSASVHNRCLLTSCTDGGLDTDLSRSIRTYSDTLSEYLKRHGLDFFLYNRRVES
jgi:hypothetical protein